VTALKSSAASAAMKLHCDGGRLLRAAFLPADEMDATEMSIPVDWVKRLERVMVNSPEPE